MKKLLAIIVLSLYFITPILADDIKEFQIEGMSLGDSVLDFIYKKNFLQFELKNDFKNK